MRDRSQLGGIPWPPLYDPRFEHDACGVGFIAQISGERTHDLVEKAILAVINVTHRGAVSADGKSGDGAGVLSQLPLRLFQREATRLGHPPPEGWRLGVGMIFLPQDAGRKRDSVRLIEEAVEGHGLRVLGWRPVPIDPDALGEKARNTMPDIQQVLVAAPPEMSEIDAERRLYLARKRAEKAAGALDIDDLYIPSFSCRTIVYKGLFVAPQMGEFYPDLHDPDFEAAIVVFHQRYSTNTFATWFLAQPFRMLAHNGEINTLWGNRNWMRAREADLRSEEWGEHVDTLKPVVNEEGSDSAQLDNVLELLAQSGRSPAHAMMMLIPEAWEKMSDMDPDIRAFYEYHAMLMEPWDGPAAIAFTDGVVAGACLDRNGLRPSRYKVTDDGLVLSASEVGVLDLPDAHVVEKGRLAPGGMLLVDTAHQRLYHNPDIKHHVASQNPYGYWLRRKLHRLPTSGFSIGPDGTGDGHHDLVQLQRAFGYTNEDLLIILQPMGAEGHDAVWSMGDDTPLTVLSAQRRPFYSYFKQRFAQVTNPPIDSLREDLVMSLNTYAGPRLSVLEETEEHAALVEFPSPVLMQGELERIRRLPAHLQAHELKCHFDVSAGLDDLERALEQLCSDAAEAVRAGRSLLVLSDRGVNEEHAPIPMLLAVSAVHQHLIRSGLRMKADIVVETGEAWDIHHFACLLGYGASAIDPYVAFETVRSFAGQRGMESLDPQQAVDNFRSAVEAGLLKIMSKMGISTLSAYRGAQIFEAIGLNRDLVEKYFFGTPNRLGGVSLREIAEDVQRKHASAFGEQIGPTGKRGLPDLGFIRFRGQGEYHGYNPFVVKAMHKATESGDYGAYQEFVALTQKHDPATLRDLMRFRTRQPISIDEVEPTERIVRRFYTTAMSLGALSPESIRTLALATNTIGARSNSGEGGEDPDWYTHPHNGVATHNKIKQVASARFGVNSWYLSQAEELEIKIAQGSKPGEGGQLPKHKVNAFIARLRHAIPGIPLISPPPHHDIYSIEDLAQLIYDLKQANPTAHVGVKLVSEAGVGTIAAGVAKAYADYILISGDSGGTGASPLSSIKNAGCPWELGLAETQQVLVLNDLRGRVRLRTDGGLKTGRDVVIAAMVGAEEFGFGTSAVVAMGCDMARQCHLNTCPTGIATQDEKYRAKFSGTPDMVINYFTFLATEVREIMAGLGVRSLDEIIGRVDMLEQVYETPNPRAGQLDLSAILTPPDATFTRPIKRQQDRNDPPTKDPFPEELVAEAAPAWESGTRVSTCHSINNSNRAVGARLAYEVSRRYGGDGLPDGALEVCFRGSAGQSFGAFLTHGIRLVLEGEANDYVGKGMGGGEIVLRPPSDAAFTPHENIILGNTVLYGATGGKLFAAGRAGERFAVRNSGATAVVEGAGDHCCEYMTGGVVVVLGPVGRNFAAGMSAGIAYVLDETGEFPGKVNAELVELERIVDHDGAPKAEDEELLRGLIEEHLCETDSARAREVLDRWSEMLPRFWKVVPDPPTVQTHTPAMESADTGTAASDIEEPANAPAPA